MSELDISELLVDDAKREVREMLHSHRGGKCIVLDPSLQKPLDIVTEGAKLWKEDGCDARQFEQLTGANAWTGRVESGCRHVLFICRPTISLMKRIASIIRSKAEGAAGSSGGDVSYALYCVPRCTFICQQVLRDEGLTTGTYDADLAVANLEVDMIPFESDVVSFEMPGVLRDSVLESDVTSLSFVANGMLRLEAHLGTIKHLVGKGELAKRTIEMICRLRAEAGDDSKTAAADASGGDGEEMGSIDTLLVIDRMCDLVSPMVTPLTYEGLLDELIGIRSGQITVTKAILGEEEDDDEAVTPAMGGDGTEDKKRYRSLDSSDKLYSFLRDMNIASCAPYLQDKSREVQALYNQRPTDTGQSVQKLRDFVKKIPELKEMYASVQVHTSLVGIVHQTTNSKQFRDRWNLEHSMMDGETVGLASAEEAIARQESLIDVLRLLSLTCVMGGGLRTKDFDRVRRDLLQTYGYDLLLTLNNLEAVGLLFARGGKLAGGAAAPTSTIDWARVKRGFGAINNDVDSATPDDIAYVTSGYAPIFARIVEWVAKGEWAARQDALKLLPGPHIVRSMRKSAAAQAAAKVAATSTAASGLKEVRKKRRTMMVLALGGLSYMEISAIRLIASREDSKFDDIIIATTSFLNGNTLIQSLMGGDGGAVASARASK